MKQQRSSTKETKLCRTCQRPFQNRKTWKIRQQWEQVLYCSERCKRNKTV